jgi:serine/threonine protein kinase
MPLDDSRKNALSARSLEGREDVRSRPPDPDPSTEPTLSSARVDAEVSQPTRFDPDAPIHHGETTFTGPSRPTARNHVALPVGYALHEYTIETVLGSGGFGITYRACDNNLQCLVAIKEYLPNDLAVRTGGQTVCARTESDTHGYRIGLDGFLAEARVLATFRHPHIVRVSRFFEANNTAYMVMDYERGQPLRDWIKEHDPVDEARLLKMFLPLLEGLDVVHKARVLHRDIKPANIYVREDGGGLVLLDFGAARYSRSDDSRSLTSIVTPGYAPFEQYHTHGAQGPWSDLYALGGVLYWVISGEKPQEAPSRVRKDVMPSALSLGKGRYSDRLLRSVDWALTPDEADRPKSVSQLVAVMTGESDVPPALPKTAAVQPIATPRSRAGRKLLATGIGAVALLAVAMIAFYPNQQKSGPPEVAKVQPAPVTVGPSESVANEVRKPKKPLSAAKSAKAISSAKAQTADQAIPPKDDAAEESKGKALVAAAPTATVILHVTPKAEIILDGKKVGMSPPLTRLVVSAGAKHKIEIHGVGLPHYWTVDLQPGEKREIRANFDRQ